MSWRKKIGRTRNLRGSRFLQVAEDSVYALRFYYEARPWLFMLLVLVFAIQTGIPAIALIIEKTIVDRFLEGAIRGVAWAVAGYLICKLLNSLAAEFSKLLQSTLSDLAGRRTSVMVAGVLERIPTLEIYHDASYHDSLEALNSLGRRISGAVTGITSGGMALLRFASLAVVLFAVSPWIPVALTLSLIPHAAMERRLSEAQFRGTVNLAPERRKIDYIQGLLFDIGVAKEIKIFGLAPYLFDSYKLLFNSAFRKQSALHRKQALLTVAGSLLSLVGISVAVTVTVQGFRAGTLSAGSVVMALGAIQAMSGYATSMVAYLGMALQNSMYMGRLRKLVAAAGQTLSDYGSLQLDSPIETVEAQSLSFSYPGSSRPVLDGVSLTLKKGETVALVGLNGAGKTTLAKVLLGLYRPDGGSLLINGRSIGEYDLNSLRRHMGCLFQDHVKYLLTIGDNVAFGRDPEPAGDQITRAIEEAGAAGLVETAGGLEAQLGKQFGGTDLSGGEWQKLALARATVCQPDFLVLDEPSSALDAQAEHALYTRFKELSKDRICLLISHRFTTAGIADRILVMSEGQIVEEGTHPELMDRAGAYSRMYHLQAEQYADGRAGRYTDRDSDRCAEQRTDRHSDQSPCRRGGTNSGQRPDRHSDQCSDGRSDQHAGDLAERGVIR